jgi:catechol 2,3-dioxygenase-like lactoylglutathione lyase family enzyme
MNLRRIVTLVPTQNLDASVRFYRDILGLHVQSEHEDLALFEEGVGLVASSETFAETDLRLNSVMITLLVDDARAEFGRMVARGVPFVVPPTDAGDGCVAAFRDPDGNVLQILQISPPQPEDGRP